MADDRVDGHREGRAPQRTAVRRDPACRGSHVPPRQVAERGAVRRACRLDASVDHTVREPTDGIAILAGSFAI